MIRTIKHLERARCILDAVHYRCTGMMRVMEVIINRQKLFFDKGRGHLQRLVMEDISPDTFMTVREISMLSHNKSVGTPYGIFPIDSFFGIGDGS